MLSQRIRQARKLKRMTLAKLAEQTGITPQAISKYEQGRSAPRSDTLLKLARALDVTVEYLLREPTTLALEPVYRKRKLASAKDEAAFLEQVRDWLERYLQLEHLLGLDLEATPIPECFPIRVSSMDEVEAAAVRLRREWDLGLDAIGNLVAILEDRSFKIGEADAPLAVDACTLRMQDCINTPVIMFRKGVPGDRQRFSVAHELGHLMLEAAGGLDEEHAANRFAGAFLVPAATAQKELGDGRGELNLFELLALKQEYGFSMQAWIYRARDLALINEHAAKLLFIQFSENHWRKQEPGPVIAYEQPVRFISLVFRALSETLLTSSRAAELMGEHVLEFLDRSYLPSGVILENNR